MSYLLLFVGTLVPPVSARELQFNTSARASSLLVTAPELPPGQAIPWQKGDVTDFDTIWGIASGVALAGTARRTVIDADAATVTVHLNLTMNQAEAEQNVDAQVERSDGRILSLSINGTAMSEDAGDLNATTSTVDELLEVPAGRFTAKHVTRSSFAETLEYWVSPAAAPGGGLLRLVLTRSDGYPDIIVSLVRQYNRFALPAFHPGVPLTSEPIQPLPRSLPLDAGKVALGKRLFEDKRLSNGDVGTCLSCHDPHAGGSDRLPRAYAGPLHPVGHLNAPSVFNVAYEPALFWDGRAKSLEDQIDGPVLNPNELGSTWEMVLGKFRADPGLVHDFAALYPEGIQVATIKDAIASYERSLVTPDAPFDHYLLGDAAAITAAAKRGYAAFKSRGCADCHGGPLVGGVGLARFAHAESYFADRGNVVREDYGRFNVTGRERDRYKFKIPSLRNVWRTAPYFHDGSVKTLGAAIQVMSRYQDGEELPAEEANDIQEFLKSLTGTFEGEPVR